MERTERKKVAILTLGCKTNLVESDAISGALTDAGCEMVDFDSVADYYIVNTCTVTHISDRKSRQMLRRAKKHAPDSKLICMGCFSQIHREEALSTGADLVLGNGNKNLVLSYILKGEIPPEMLSDRGSEGFKATPSAKHTAHFPPRSALNNARNATPGDAQSNIPYDELNNARNDASGDAQSNPPDGNSDTGIRDSGAQLLILDDLTKFEEIPEYTAAPHTRAFIKIQDGCDRFCTYCIIPYARGRLRSRDLRQIESEVLRMVGSGYSEFVLTGIHLTSYGKDLTESNATLMDVVELLQSTEGVRRIRLGSLEPNWIDEDTVARMKRCDKLCDHFHLSLQSGCDKILKRMNRRYTASEYMEAVGMLRAAYGNPSITTDIIVGFPGEEEEDFLETLRFVEKIRFSDIHIFPYSERQGTPAVRFSGKVDSIVKKQRGHELSKIRDRLFAAYLESYVGKSIEILVEEAEGGFAKGYSANYIYAEIPDTGLHTGQYYTVEFRKEMSRIPASAE